MLSWQVESSASVSHVKSLIEAKGNVLTNSVFLTFLSSTAESCVHYYAI